MSVKITILNSGMKMIIMRLIIIASLQKDDRYEAIRNIAWLLVLNLLHKSESECLNQSSSDYIANIGKNLS